jgi:hypothetical protein
MMAIMEKVALPIIAEVYNRRGVAVPERHRALQKWAVIVFTIATLLASWESTIQRIPADRPVIHDAWQNLTLAYNLSHHGVMSLSHDSADLAPSSRREPLPAAFLAFYMASVEAVYGNMTLGGYGTGLGTGRLKVSNVFWAALLAYSVFVSIVRLSGSFLLAGMGTWFSNLTVLQYFNNLLTEPHAAALLTLACYLSIVALSRRRALYFGLAGVCFGALALTKAATFYVVMVLACLLFGWSLWQLKWPTETRFVRIPSVIVFVLGVALTTGPWMSRNYVLLNSMEIVGEAAPVVLMVRAEKNKMSWMEYRGGFYAWAPNELLRKAASDLLGFIEADLRRGGRLQRLNRSSGSEFYASDMKAVRAGRPEDAVSFLKKAQAEKQKMKRELAAQGYSGLDAESELQRRAIRQISGEPLKHMAMSVLFLWRGAGLIFPPLALVATYAAVARRSELMVYILPVLGLVFFYALATHFHPRYGQPLLPVTIVGVLVLSHAVVRYWINRLAGWMGFTERQGTCHRA